MKEENVSPENDYKSTPPTNRKVRNPFEKVLIEKLHQPICSPGMCKIYKKQKSGSFKWDINQECELVPNEIVPCNSQFEPSPDPALEKIAEEANEKFLSQELVMPSPLESSKKTKPLQTSYDTSSHVSIMKQTSVVTRDFSAQTVLSLPPELPPEIEKILQTYCTFTQDQDISGEYEMTANGSLRRKLLFEEHSDMEHDDSEQSDDEEIHIEKKPPPIYEAHTPVMFSPDVSKDLVTKGMSRTFGTPLTKGQSTYATGFRNKILDAVDFGEACLSPIHFQTPGRPGTSSSLTSISISPVTKVASSDEEKNNFTSPESEPMATCLDFIISDPESEKNPVCFCKSTPDKSVLKRTTSLKESPPKNRKGSFSEKRSLSMSSLNRSRSVQKLDFSMDMSLDGSMHSDLAVLSSPPPMDAQTVWSIVEETSIHKICKVKTQSESLDIRSSTKILYDTNPMDDTPIKTKKKSNVLSHEISKIRSYDVSPLHMSLDTSLDSPLGLEDKKVDFNTVDLNFFTDSVSQSNCTDKVDTENSTSFKRVDSGFNENTFYANASSYYGSAIKPSELTVTSLSRAGNSEPLKEISNINWMRVDSGFKDENSADNVNFYVSGNSIKNTTDLCAKVNDFDKPFFRAANKNDAMTMSMSDIFNEDMKLNCNFSSTPSKNKSRKFTS